VARSGSARNTLGACKACLSWSVEPAVGQTPQQPSQLVLQKGFCPTAGASSRTRCAQAELPVSAEQRKLIQPEQPRLWEFGLVERLLADTSIGAAPNGFAGLIETEAWRPTAAGPGQNDLKGGLSAAMIATEEAFAAGKGAPGLVRHEQTAMPTVFGGAFHVRPGQGRASAWRPTLHAVRRWGGVRLPRHKGCCQCPSHHQRHDPCCSCSSCREAIRASLAARHTGQMELLFNSDGNFLRQVALR